jgi:hypothetical protein
MRPGNIAVARHRLFGRLTHLAGEIVVACSHASGGNRSSKADALARTQRRLGEERKLTGTPCVVSIRQRHRSDLDLRQPRRRVCPLQVGVE